MLYTLVSFKLIIKNSYGKATPKTRKSVSGSTPTDLLDDFNITVIG